MTSFLSMQTNFFLMISHTKTLFSMMVIFSFAIIMGTSSSVFADHSEVTIEAATGSGAPGCETTSEGCYIPKTATVDVGGVVIFSNTDNAAHTFTAGTPADGPSAEFDTGLLTVGNSFEYSPDTIGEIEYFCMVHPWMVGSLVVQTAGSGEEEEFATLVVNAPSEEETTVTGLSSDGQMRVEITASNPAASEVMTVDVKFRDSSSALVQHANYDIVAMQGGQEILSMMGAHEHEGQAMHTTAPLASDEPVDIKVTLLGFGLPDDEANWTGPKGEIITFNVVPEFGTIAAMILAVAIISTIAVTARSKLSIMPRI